MPPSALHGIQAPPLPILHLFHFQKAYWEHSFDFFGGLWYNSTKDSRRRGVSPALARKENDHGKPDPQAAADYDFIQAFAAQHGYPPSVREIGEAVGLKSPSTVHFHLKRLEEAGVIEKGAGKGRAITLRNPPPPEDRVPVVGNVAAGSPILAEENIEDYLAF